jgi:hypothetical protein
MRIYALETTHRVFDLMRFGEPRPEPNLGDGYTILQLERLSKRHGYYMLRGIVFGKESLFIYIARHANMCKDAIDRPFTVSYDGYFQPPGSTIDRSLYVKRRSLSALSICSSKKGLRRSNQLGQGFDAPHFESNKS